ncbi:MAG: hypothetical protein NC923_01835 [Candidatus Omnitrophica bacterium]|nr:hypothetical protein [Candidatus Omnitrophota bacterium]
MRKITLLLLSGILICCHNRSFADNVILKDGSTFEVTITEETKDYVRLNFKGVELTYYNKEILKVVKNGKEIVREEITPPNDKGSERAVVAELLDLLGVRQQWSLHMKS